MGNQTSCCAQNKEITPSEFHFNAPIDGLHKQFPDTTTNQDDSTNPSSALRKGIHTDYSMTKTQQDLSDNIRDQDPKKKKKLMRKKPPPLTDLGSLQDCTSVAQGPVQAQSPKYFENENGNENCEAIERKRACWEIDEDKNLSIRLSERRPVLQERTANLNCVENDGIESVRKDEARGIQSRKDVIEAGIIAQKYGEEDIDDEFDNEDDYDVMPKKEDAVGYQPNAYPGALANIEKQYRSTQGEKLTEVFETPREEIEEISDSVNYGYGNDGEKTFTIPQDSAAQSYREAGAKSNRSAQDRLVYAYTQHVGNQTNQQNTVYYTQEEEVQKTVSTSYEDAFSCSMYMGKKIHEFNERTLQDGAFGNESARSMNKKESRPKEDPLSARKQREYQDQNNKSPVREDEAKLLSGLYQTCQSVVPAEAFEASPICKGDRENQMRSSFCGEDRKLFVSEIIKNIQMKNAYNKDKGTPQRENSWLARAERETGNIDVSKRESVQKEVQKLVDSAFKPRNSLLENILRQSKESNKGLENFVVKRDDWREELNKKTQYSHPFSNNDYTMKGAILQRPQQEQMREYQNYGLDTPGFKNEGLLNKSWEKYSVQERKDMLLTKRFMDIPVDGADN